MIKFLASAYFALILLALSALAVITATFLESHSSSHTVAEEWIYQHPLFHLLLAGYFINILLSALSRWPFQKKHLPFLITHLGLLMLISGVFIKSIFGIQGQLLLIEGSASDQLLLPQQPALLIEGKNSAYSLPLIDKKLPKNGLGVQLLDWHPHAKEKFIAWQKIEEIAPLPKKMTVIQRKGVALAEAAHEAKTFKSPFLLIHQDDKQTTLLTKDLQGELFQKTFLHDYLEGWVAYDRGFQGYTVQAELPFVTEKDAREAQLVHEEGLRATLREHREAFSPPLELIKEAAQKTHLDFPTIALDYLKEWHKSEKWLFKEKGPAWVDQLPWEKVPQEELNALYWMSTLWEKELLEHLKERKWPLLEPLKAVKNGSQENSVDMAWMHQLYQVRAQLPSPPSTIAPDIANGMLSAYLRLYNIHYSDLPKADLPSPTITLETPLYRQIQLAPPPEKREEATPYILVQVDGESIPLVYNPQEEALKWPTFKGHALLRFQPHRISLPYSVRLHRAIDLKYPGSDQTLSYECSLSLRNKITDVTTRCHLSMNKVYETAEGYRFYLAGMGTIDPLGVRSVQLVINRDPAKYWLTYPGGLLVALGIALLFWFRN